MGKLNALKPTYEFDESYLPPGSHVIIHVLKDFKGIKDWKPDNYYNGIVGSYDRHYDPCDPMVVQYSCVIKLFVVNEKKEVKMFTTTPSSIVNGELEIIKVSQ